MDHDVHFRPGVGADGSETYTPRTVIYDLKGGFGTLRKHNALYELTEDATTGQGLWYVEPATLTDLICMILTIKIGMALRLYRNKHLSCKASIKEA